MMMKWRSGWNEDEEEEKEEDDDNNDYTLFYNDILYVRF